jgi:hypothetical protein
MSAVASVAKAVVKPVAKAVEQVGDVVKDVGKAVEKTAKAVAENPEIIVIAVAAPYAVASVGAAAGASAATIAAITPPITAAAITASQGGDLEDIGKAALTAYVAPKVGQQVAGAVAQQTAGSALQNTLASAAGGAASGATAAAIQGGDIGQSALLGAAGSAGASIGRDIAAAAEYGTDIMSDQTRQLVSQDVGVNRFADIGADIGTALGRAIVSGDVEGELMAVAQAAGSRELANQLRDAFAAGDSDEAARAEEAIAAELETNPMFAEQIQLAQIAAGDVILTTDQKIDALAEAVARDAFAEAVAGGEQVAALPAVALPIAVNAAARAAQTAAPLVVRRVAQFAANDPRFAQVMITNPYTQQLLAAAGLTMTVSLTGDVSVNPIEIPDQSAAETARLNRYATEIAKTVDNVNPENLRQLEEKAVQTERGAETSNARDQLLQRQAELNRLADQGFSVQRELERVQTALSRPIPTIDVTQPAVNIPAQPGTLPPPTIDIRAEPVTRPGTTTRPGTAPEVAPTPRPGEEFAPEPAPETAPETAPIPRPGEEAAPETRPAPRPDARPVQRLEPAPREPGRAGEPRAPVPIEIEDLFTDQDILDLIRQGLGEDFVTGTTEAAGIEAGEAGEGAIRPTVDTRAGMVGRTRTPVSSISQRAVSTGPGAITGMKEPTFGGDPGEQQEVWNQRSLRLRKALGL